MLHLECGRTLGPVDVAYETYGRLNEERSNAVLICHALSGDAHAAGYHSPDDRKPGWWEIHDRPGQGHRHQQVLRDLPEHSGRLQGNDRPSSINPATGKPWGMDFPVITIEDMVKVQKRR